MEKYHISDAKFLMLESHYDTDLLHDFTMVTVLKVHTKTFVQPGCLHMFHTHKNSQKNQL
jgi:hypothetical protein